MHPMLARLLTDRVLPDGIATRLPEGGPPPAGVSAIGQKRTFARALKWGRYEPRPKNSGRREAT